MHFVCLGDITDVVLLTADEIQTGKRMLNHV